jgi:hypothetical protein
MPPFDRLRVTHTCLAKLAGKVEKKPEPTVGFTVWPVLLTLEGPTSMIGIALSAIYGDEKIPRTEWHCEHKFASRAEFATHLIGGGKEIRRVGVGTKSSEIAEKIRAKAEASGVKCAIFRGVTDSTQK